MIDFLDHYQYAPEFVAACFGLLVASVILLVGWVTRTLAVVILSIGLTLFWGLAIAAVIGLGGVNGDAYPFFDRDLSLLLTTAGIALILDLLAAWAAIRLWRQGQRLIDFSRVRHRSTRRGDYDREWLLSLLQQQAASARERVSTVPAGPKGPSAAPPAKS